MMLVRAMAMIWLKGVTAGLDCPEIDGDFYLWIAGNTVGSRSLPTDQLSEFYVRIIC